MQINKIILDYYAAAAQAHNRNAISHAVSPQAEEKRGDLLNPKDTVNFSAAAREAAANPAAVSATENNGNNPFKEQGDSQNSNANAYTLSPETQSAEIKARISQLASNLSQVMSSALPENVKTARAGSLYGQISELSARLAQLQV